MINMSMAIAGSWPISVNEFADKKEGNSLSA
eukprot:CAMPEP_0170471044 /NCGR_PEP_ID=MMETSP0123-20130129/13356_1 /TAXON_ID=182087 /ORGANISM="Favella ehrenbergii, Strain Fehren 1" /LENGTH=30 /DNA_ID= /DNA_START= /DNA_END= /DNA_ORIENTATION=